MAMIKNERQYRITNTQAEKFRPAIAEDEPKAKTAAQRLVLAGARSQLETLEGELRTYENLQNAKGKQTLTEPIERFGALLVQARTARGWSQRELGDRIGVKMQQ